MGSELQAQLQEVLAPVVSSTGLFLEGVEVSGPARKRLVRVTVDLLDGPGGIGSDQLGDVSKAISTALDAVDDILEGAYLLEVSTPGVSRPLTEARHFRRAVGRVVTVQTTDGEVGGRVIAVDADAVHLAKAQRKGEPIEQAVPLATITRGRVEVELRRAEDVEG